VGERRSFARSVKGFSPTAIDGIEKEHSRSRRAHDVIEPAFPGACQRGQACGTKALPRAEDPRLRAVAGHRRPAAGQAWKVEIPKAIRDAAVFLACLSSRSVAKVGYVQNEFRLTLSSFAQRPPGSIYLIPVRLDDCEVPDLQIPDLGLGLRDVHWVDLFAENGLDRLVRALREGAGITPASSALAAAPVPLRVFRDIDAPWCREMVVIPAGRFVRGSPTNEPSPQLFVTIGEPFALGRYPVTFEEYDHFCATTGRHKPDDWVGDGAVCRSSMLLGATPAPTQLGSGRQRGRPIGCRARRNGSMRVEPAPALHIGWARRSTRRWPTVATAARDEPLKSAAIRPTPGVCATCWAMPGSGKRISGAKACSRHLTTVPLGSRQTAETIRIGSSAAVSGPEV